MYKALTLNTLNIKSVKTFLYKTAIEKMALKLHTNTQLAITRDPLKVKGQQRLLASSVCTI